MIDNESAFYEFAVKQKRFDRTKVLFDNAIEYIVGVVGSDAKEVLSDCIGLNKSEVVEVLCADMSEKQDEGMKMCRWVDLFAYCDVINSIYGDAVHEVLHMRQM